MLSVYNNFNLSWFRVRIAASVNRCGLRHWIISDCRRHDNIQVIVIYGREKMQILFRVVPVCLSEDLSYWTFWRFSPSTTFHCLTKPRIFQTVMPQFDVIYSKPFLFKLYCLFILILCRLTVFYVRQLYHIILLLLCRQYNIIIHIRSPQ